MKQLLFIYLHRMPECKIIICKIYINISNMVMFHQVQGLLFRSLDIERPFKKYDIPWRRITGNNLINLLSTCNWSKNEIWNMRWRRATAYLRKKTYINVHFIFNTYSLPYNLSLQSLSSAWKCISDQNWDLLWATFLSCSKRFVINTFGKNKNVDNQLC